MADQREFDVVRVKLGPDKPAPRPDALGRPRIGFISGLDAAELWERGRGVWRARLDKVSDAQLLLIASAGTVVMVGTVTGITFHDGRVAVTGFPDPSHPLIGQPDPLDNNSANPVAYGTLETTPAMGAPQRPFEDVLGDAVAVLTEAGRRRRSRLHQTPTGQWEPHPTETDPADWAEFVTLALAGAAANLGGIAQALAGRPGSWEAAKVEDLLYATVGTDEEDLWRHRTEPVRLVVDVDELLADRTDAWSQYNAAEHLLYTRQTAAEEADPYPDQEAYGWDYKITGPDQFTPVSPDAPAWSWDIWRERATNHDFAGQIEQQIRTGDAFFITSLFIPRSPEIGAEYDRLCAERDTRLELFDQQLEQLEAQKQREWDAYGAALTRSIETAAQAIPGLQSPVEVTVATQTDSVVAAHHELDPLAERLLEAAVAATPSPADLPGTPLERLDRKNG
jgi:hypothetical protein